MKWVSSCVQWFNVWFCSGLNRGSMWDRFGSKLGSICDQVAVKFGFDLESRGGRMVVEFGSLFNVFRAFLGAKWVSIWDPCWVDFGFI